MRKLIACFFSSLLLFAATPVLAQAQSDNAQIPEKNGDYADPEHPGMRVRVFVHEPKDARGTPSVSTFCPDNDSASIVPPAGWHLPNGTWTYNVNVSSVPSSVGSNISTVVGESFGKWNAAQGKVTIIRGDDTTINRKGFDGKNIVAWGRTSGSALAVTYTWYYTATHEVAEVDTIMNLKFPWSWTPYALNACGIANTYDAQDILTHEIGHWMGLNDTYDAVFGDNTMFGYGSRGEIKKDTLTTGDIAGVQNIYK